MIDLFDDDEMIERAFAAMRRRTARRTWTVLAAVLGGAVVRLDVLMWRSRCS